jgi:hypothetical protein
MVIQPRVLVQQTEHRANHAQLTASVPARRHPTQRGRRLRAWPQQQTTRQTDHHQQCNGHQGKQSRPRADLLDSGLGKAQPSFCIAKARFTARTVRILRDSLRRRIGPIGDQIPESPLALRIPLAAHRHPQRLRAPRTVQPPPQTAMASIAPKAQGMELAPAPSDANIRAIFDPYDKRYTNKRTVRYYGYSCELYIAALGS